MAKITLCNITKVFDGKVVAVDNLSMEVPHQGLISLLGPSGCGKTTTMRIIAGLETPTSGEVYFDDENVTDVHPRERDVAMVFQFPVLYPAMSVFDNIAFPLEARKISKKEIKRRVEEVVEILDLGKYIYHRPRDLDAGLRQRVVLARAFVRRPKVYLLDEPLTNVDPATRIELRAELKRMHSELGQTMIYVTHDQSEALTLADKIAVMSQGKLLQYDAPEVIYENPTNRFVGWFLGNPGMTFFNCELKEREGKVCLDAGIFTYEIPSLARIIKEKSSDKRLIMGIRPEHIEVSQTKKPGWLKTKCYFIEPLGNRFIIHLDLNGQKIRAKVSSNYRVSKGKSVWINFPEEYIRVFDGQSQNLII